MDIGITTDATIKQYGGIVLKIAKQYASGCPQEFNDLVQAGMVGLYEALKTYDDKKGSISTWLYIHIRSEIQKQKNSYLLVKVAPATAKKHHLTLCDLDAMPEKSTEDTAYDHMVYDEDQRDKAQKLQKLWSKMNKKFNRDECAVLIDYFANNLSVRVIQKKFRFSVYPVIKRAQEMIKERIFLASSTSSEK